MHCKASSVNNPENFRRCPTLLKTIALAATIAILFCSIQANAYQRSFRPSSPTCCLCGATV